MKGRTSEGPRKTQRALLQATEVDEGEPGGQKLPVRTQGAWAELGLAPFYLLPLVPSVPACNLVGDGFAKPGGFTGSSCKEVCVGLPAELCASQGSFPSVWESPLSVPALVIGWYVSAAETHSLKVVSWAREEQALGSNPTAIAGSGVVGRRE